MQTMVPLYGFGGGGGRDDMQSIAAAFAQMPPGQLKKILTQEIIDILAKYGVVIG